MKPITTIAALPAAAIALALAACASQPAATKPEPAKAAVAAPASVAGTVDAAPKAAPAAPKSGTGWTADRSATLPKRPEDLKYAALDFTPPKAKDFRRTLPDGTPVYLAPSKEFPLVSLTLTFKGGPYLDPKDVPGLTAAMAALMRTGGTMGIKPADLDEKLDFLATNAGVSSGGTAVSATMNTLASNLDESMRLFFDMLRSPGFDQARLDILRGQAMEGMKQRNDEAGAILGREWSYLIYGDDHFESAQPTKDSWDAVTQERLRAQHARIIHPGNVIVSVTGDFDPDDMMKRLAAAMDGWKRGEMAPNPPVPTHALKPGVYHVGKDIPQGKVRIGRRSIQRDDPDYYAAEVMNDILGGGGFTSRLMKNIRSNEGLAYSVGSRFSAGTYYPGQFTGAFESKNATVALAIKLMRDEFKRMQGELVTAEELEVAKKGFVEAFPGQFSSKDATLGLFVADEWTGRDPEFWQRYRDNIQKVSAADVQRVAKKYLNFDDMAVMVVGKWDEIAPGDQNGRAKMVEFFGGKAMELPLRDPMTMKPMDTPQSTDAK
ncbi:MAG: insulinase family protein [Planctomycetes bacterium]|nr:insulinase family protein [Planctomycetota bacterium]